MILFFVDLKVEYMTDAMALGRKIPSADDQSIQNKEIKKSENPIFMIRFMVNK